MRRVQKRDSAKPTGDAPRDFFRLMMRLRYGLTYRNADLVWFTCRGYTHNDTLSLMMGCHEGTTRKRRTIVLKHLDVRDDAHMVYRCWFLFREVCRIYDVSLDYPIPARSVGIDDLAKPLFVEDGLFYYRHWWREMEAAHAARVARREEQASTGDE